MLGHASQNVTQDYVHIDEAPKLAVQRTSDEIARLLDRGTETKMEIARQMLKRDPALAMTTAYSIRTAMRYPGSQARPSSQISNRVSSYAKPVRTGSASIISASR